MHPETGRRFKENTNDLIRHYLPKHRDFWPEVNQPCHE
jgi:IS30 family transposase